MGGGRRSRPKNISIWAAKPSGTAPRFCDTAGTSSRRIRRISASHGRSATTKCAPYYEQAERLLGVRTFDTEPDLLEIITRLRRISPAWMAVPLPLGLAPARSWTSAGGQPLRWLRLGCRTQRRGETRSCRACVSMPNLTPDGRLGRRSPGRGGQPAAIVGVRLADGRELHARRCCSPPARCIRRASWLDTWTQRAC